MVRDQIILGIDPGTTVMGYGLLQVKNNKPYLVAMGVLDLKKYIDHYQKLQRIFMRTLSLIDEFHPDCLAIEAPFFGKNVQSMLKLGRAQGVAMAAALSRDLPITEYMPRKIKMAITGNGLRRSRWPTCCAVSSRFRMSKCCRSWMLPTGWRRLIAITCNWATRCPNARIRVGKTSLRRTKTG